MESATPSVLKNMREYILSKFSHLLLPEEATLLTAVIHALSKGVEYVLAELIELSGNACRDVRLKVVNAIHIKTAVANDVELNKVFKSFCWQGAAAASNNAELLSMSTAVNIPTKAIGITYDSDDFEGRV